MSKSLNQEKRDNLKKEKKANQIYCTQCPASLNGLLKSKAFCVFCENYVCKSHIVKKRQDPLIQEKIAKICRECEENILYKQIMSKHQKKEKELQEKEIEFQSQLNELNATIQDILTKQSTVQFQMHKEQDEFNKKEQRFLGLLKDADDRQEELNEENLKLNETHRKLLEEKKSWEQKKALETEKNNQIKKDEEEQKQRIGDINQQIQTIDYEISALNQEIVQITLNQKAEDPQSVKDSQTLSYQQIGTINILDSQFGKRPSIQKGEIGKQRRKNQKPNVPKWCCN